MRTVLEAKDITKNFYMGSHRIAALKKTNLDITLGSINVFVGKSGSGKSTLLNILGGLLKPDSGEVLIEDIPLFRGNESARTKLRCRKIGYIFQNFNLIDELSVINNIRLPVDIACREYDKQAEKEIFDMLELNDRLLFYPDQLSGGERQRTAIARALLMDPMLILADEPTGNLDLESAKNFMSYVEKTNKNRAQTYVIVTHDQEWRKIAHHVYKMSDGVLIKEPTNECR